LDLIHDLAKDKIPLGQIQLGHGWRLHLREVVLGRIAGVAIATPVAARDFAAACTEGESKGRQIIGELKSHDSVSKNSMRFAPDSANPCPARVGRQVQVFKNLYQAL
jgi:hypothetical protein